MPIVGKYVSLHDAYLSVTEALRHAAIPAGCRIHFRYVSSEEVEAKGPEGLLKGADAIVLPGGFGPRGMEGMVITARYARENRIPFLGIGLGMQMAAVDAARLGGIADAHTAECESGCTPVFVLPQNGSAQEKYMRRGAQPIRLEAGSRIAAAYGSKSISERHHNRWEFDPAHADALRNAGFGLTGWSADGKYLDAIELPGHPFHIGVIYQPEFKSRPTRPHPLFAELIAATVRRKTGEA